MMAIDDLLERAMAAHRQGQLGEAQRLYSALLELAPNHFDGLHLLGLVKFQLGEQAQAKSLIEAALALQPDSALACSNYGLVLDALGRTQEALASYEKALSIAPDFVEAHYNRGNALQSLNRGEEALASYSNALALNGNHVDALNNRGNALQLQNRREEALASYSNALAVNGDYVAALNNRGNLLREMERYAEALADFDQVLAIVPGHTEANFNRGLTLQALGRSDEAVVSHDRAAASNPQFVAAQLAACISVLPALYGTESEITTRRTAYERRLRAVCEAASIPGAVNHLANFISTAQPFYLGYQGQNDRALQALYGNLVCRVLAANYPAVPLADPPMPNEPVRVGFVSGYFCRHSVWKIPIKGWLDRLDRQKFRVTAYHTSSVSDEFTAAAAAMCHRFVANAPTIGRWRQEISADRPHVLIYPEVGMDPTTTQLAAQRLAPVQCVSLGHPVTTGLSTLDYFLTSDLMEPPDGETHYTERLVRLPNLSVYYEPLAIPPRRAKRAELGLRPDSIVYWCGQSLYKYLPQFDQVFARIARDVGACQFVFIRFDGADHLTEAFRRRLNEAFAAVGLRAEDHCVLLPRMGWEAFGAATGAADVFLDSFSWSGFNSTMESLPHALPIVTMPGSLMRGRHSAAILEMMGITETIATSIDDYVAIAVRLARDASWLAEIKAKMTANSHRVYRDTACIAALEEFLDRAARSGQV
jgi:predicted O-linked N-acetylglucosamine transferase (SPINDLY family)